MRSLIKLTFIYDRMGESTRLQNNGISMKNGKLNSELARLLYKQAPFVSISMYALLAVTLYFFWSLIPHSLLLTWGGTVFAFSTLMLLLTWRYHAKTPSGQGDGWIRAYTYLTFLQDISWGVIGPISFIADNESYHLLILFMLGGMAAGSIATRGVVFKTYVVSITALLSPILLTLAIQHDTVSKGMLLLTLIYLLFMLSVGKSYSSSISKSILLWLDNEKLIIELNNSKTEIEHANDGLRLEIDQRKSIEAELLQAKERAERASEAKNQFLANVSHELRTPLNGIIGFSSILEKEELTEEQSGFVSQINRSAHSLLRNVNDILDITAIEAGHLKLYEQPFSLATELQDVLALMRPLAAQNGLNLEGHFKDAVYDTLLGDASRLRQVITNILSNAIKYTEKGGIELRVRQVDKTPSKVTLRFDIEDTGIGIPESAADSVFDNFTQVDSFDHKRVEGVGLGLAIVKNLLTKMGGRIWLSSAPGKGTTFSFELPFKIATELPLPNKDSDLETDNALEYLQRLNVLVVDDNAVNRMVLTTFLRQHGISYQEASSGKRALELIGNDHFDVVLLDIQMPDISGIEVARQLMNLNREIPSLIAVTAHAFPEQRSEIIAAGFSEFLVKPISEQGLLNVLRSVKDVTTDTSLTT